MPVALCIELINQAKSFSLNRINIEPFLDFGAPFFSINDAIAQRCAGSWSAP